MRYYPDELYHFGIKGMKWGVRRFQRKDGSYTKQGLARERNGSNGSTKGDKAARRERIKKIAKGASIAGVAIGGTYLAYKNRDKIAKMIGGRKTGPATSGTQIDAKQMAANIKALDKVTHQQVPFNRTKVDRVQPTRIQPDRYSTAFGNFSTRTPRAGTASRSKTVNKALVRDLSSKKKRNEKAAFADFDRGMMDPDAKMVFDNKGAYFKKSDGSTINPNWDAVMKTRAWKKPKIKKSKVSRKRSNSRVSGGSGRSYSDPIHHRINIQRQREY